VSDDPRKNTSPYPFGLKQRRPLVFLVISTCLYEMQCDSHPHRFSLHSELSGALTVIRPCRGRPLLYSFEPRPGTEDTCEDTASARESCRRGHACRAGRAGRPAGCSPPPPVRAEYVRFLNFPNAGARGISSRSNVARTRGRRSLPRGRSDERVQGYTYRRREGGPHYLVRTWVWPTEGDLQFV
jgi:hypothetical protein